jgi:hypothetical protein
VIPCSERVAESGPLTEQRPAANLAQGSESSHVGAGIQRRTLGGIGSRIQLRPSGRYLVAMSTKWMTGHEPARAGGGRNTVHRLVPTLCGRSSRAASGKPNVVVLDSNWALELTDLAAKHACVPLVRSGL